MNNIYLYRKNIFYFSLSSKSFIRNKKAKKVDIIKEN